MPNNLNQPWGLIVPGRPGTPSEGAAQQYTRIGPRESQRIKTFENGTCLEFGPDDPVDEFRRGHPFDSQIAQIDTVIRDIRVARQRYEGPNTRRAFNEGNRDNTPVENDPFVNFRIQPPGQLIPVLGFVQLPSGTYAQVASKYASCGSLISTYSIMNKSDWPGDAHPGNSDSRFGQVGKMVYPALPRNSHTGNAKGRAKQPNRLQNIIANYKQRTPNTPLQIAPGAPNDQESQALPRSGAPRNLSEPKRNFNGNFASPAGEGSFNNFANQAGNFTGQFGNVMTGFAGNFPLQVGSFDMQARNFIEQAANFGGPGGNFVTGSTFNIPVYIGNPIQQENGLAQQIFTEDNTFWTGCPTGLSSELPSMDAFSQQSGYGHSRDATSNNFPVSEFVPLMNFRTPQSNMAFGNFPGIEFSNSNGPISSVPPESTSRSPEQQPVNTMTFEKLPGGGLSTASPIKSHLPPKKVPGISRQAPTVRPYENLPQAASCLQQDDRKPFQEFRPHSVQKPDEVQVFEQHYQEHKRNDSISQPENSQLPLRGSMQGSGQGSRSPIVSSTFAKYLDDLNAMSAEMGHQFLEGDRQSGHDRLQAQFNVPIEVVPSTPVSQHATEPEKRRNRLSLSGERNFGARQHRSFMDRLQDSPERLQWAIVPSALRVPQGQPGPLGTQELAIAGGDMAVPHERLDSGSPLSFINGSKIRRNGGSNTDDEKVAQRRRQENTAGKSELSPTSANSLRNHLNPSLDISLARSFNQIALLSPLCRAERPSSGFEQFGHTANFTGTSTSLSMPGTRTVSPLPHPGNPRTPDDQIGLLSSDSNAGEGIMGGVASNGPIPRKFAIPARRRLFER